MKKLILSATVVAAAVLALTAKTKDPVVMTVDNRDVHLSEFEYLYNKNNNQQITPLTFDQYVDMFVNYKLKVADALNARLDTTAEFRTEFEKFRRDLAQPYLRDEETAERLVNDVYSHTLEDVYVSHIMLPAQDPQAKQKIDSIRQLIVSGQITFEDAARQNSVDRPSAARGGLMGWVTGMSPYPWTFEDASYYTPVGEISEAVNSGVGYHLIRPEKRRKARGEVKVQHILLLTRDMDNDAAEAQRQRIDSIYDVVIQPGVDFGEVAMRESQDPGSARNGGLIDWFGSGRMVAEFDSISFALPDGAISKPFATSYGYHIVHKLAHRDPLSLDERRADIEKVIANDNMRASMPITAKIEKTAKATNSSLDPDLDTTVRSIVGIAEGATDEAMIQRLKESSAPAYTAIGKVVTIGEALEKAPLRPQVPVYVLLETVDRSIRASYNNAITDYIIDQLELTEPSYSNLVNEYRDGILLFDISNRNVWERATKDTQGLKDYFTANRDKYSTWETPHYKAYVIFAANDSTLNEIMTYAQANYGGLKISEINQEAFMDDMKAKFPRTAKIERVIASKGDNAITDYLAFGGAKPDSNSKAWSAYAAFAGEVIDQPEEVSDVRGAVVTDYQNKLETEWLDQLHQKYKVKINKKALKKADK